MAPAVILPHKAK